MDNRVITFKRPNDVINIGGQVIGQHNITPEKYDELVRLAPAHADLFIVTEPEKKESEKKEKEPKAIEAKA